MNDSNSPTSSALFDLDQTLVPYDMQLLFGNWILRRRPLRRVYLLLFLAALPFKKWLGTARLKCVYLSLLHRMSAQELNRETRAFVDHYLPALFYPEVLQRLRSHQQKGDHLVLSSASPLFYVSHIGKALGIEDVYGTVVQVPSRMPLIPSLRDGNNKSEEKIRRLKAQFEKKGWDWSVPLPGSTSYTDSTADLPLLKAAEQAVLIHPSSKLVAHTEASHPGHSEVLRPKRVSQKRLIFHFVLMFFGLFPLSKKGASLPPQSSVS